MPSENTRKILLIFDINETILHKLKEEPQAEGYEKITWPYKNGKKHKTFYVKLRPGLKDFLKYLSDNKTLFEVRLWTCSYKSNMKTIVEKCIKDLYGGLDVESHVWYQDKCGVKKWFNASYTKLCRTYLNINMCYCGGCEEDINKAFTKDLRKIWEEQLQWNAENKLQWNEENTVFIDNSEDKIVRVQKRNHLEVPTFTGDDNDDLLPRLKDYLSRLHASNQDVRDYLHPIP